VTTPESAIVVVAPEGDPHDDVREILEEWALAGLLQPILWVTDFVQTHRDAPPDIPAQLLARAVEATDVIVDLASRPMSLIRLVCLQVLTPDSRGDVELAQQARRVAHWIDRARPDRSELVRINLVVPLTETTELDDRVLQPGWETNVVAAPEQRQGDAYADVFVRADNVATHAAIHLATAACAWAGTSEGPLDRHELISGDRGIEPIVMRAYARAIVSAEVVTGVLERALAVPDEWPNPSLGDERALTASDPRRVVEQAVADAMRLDHGALTFSPPKERPAPPQRRNSLLAAIGAMLRHFWALVRRVPNRLATTVVRASIQIAENVTTQTVYGPDSRIARFAGRARPDDEMPTLAEAEREMVDYLGQLEQPIDPARLPDVWIGLRAAVLGLIDGGPMPEPFDAPAVGGRREVITRPALLVPPPAPGFELPPDVTSAHPALVPLAGQLLGPCDPLETERWLTLLEHAASALQHDADRAAAQVADALERLEKCKARVEDDALADDERAAARTELARCEREHGEATDRFASLEKALARVGDARTELEDWRKKREQALLWRVAERTGASVRKAMGVVADFAAAARSAADPVDFEALESTRRRTERWWLITFAAAVGLSIWSFMRMSWQDALWATAGLGVLWFVVAFLLYRSLSVALYHAERQRDLRIHQHQHATAGLLHAARESSRLTAAYRQLVDWCEIIGWSTHRPWEPPGQPADSPALPSVPQSDAPAFRVARGETSEAGLRTMAARSIRHIAREGWMDSIYRATEERAMSELRDSEGLPPDAPPPDPAADTPRSPTGARSTLLKGLRGQELRSDAGQEVARNIVGLYEGTPPSQLFVSVRPTDDDRDTFAPLDFLRQVLPVNPGVFPTSLFAAQAQLAGHHTPKRIIVWLPSTEDATPWFDVPRQIGDIPVDVWTAKTRADLATGYIALCVRADLSSRLPPGELSLCPTRTDPDMPPSDDHGAWT
jgi:hypothetical protein